MTTVEFCGPDSDGPDSEWINAWVYQEECGWLCEGCGCCQRRGVIYAEGRMFFWDDFETQHPPRVWLGEASTWGDAKRIVKAILLEETA